MNGKLYYRSWFIRRFWLQLLTWPLTYAVELLIKKQFHEGIGIMSTNPNASSAFLFVAQTVAALDLIKARDPRRFRRIKREMRIVSDMCPQSHGSYNRPWRECQVDLDGFDFANQPDLSLERYCCLLIHEATHGHCHSRFIPYDRRLRSRIECLCRLEEKRFARHAFPETWQEYVREFDPADWDFSWHASRWEKFVRRWQKFKKLLARKKTP